MLPLRLAGEASAVIMSLSTRRASMRRTSASSAATLSGPLLYDEGSSFTMPPVRPSQTSPGCCPPPHHTRPGVLPIRKRTRDTQRPKRNECTWRRARTEDMGRKGGQAAGPSRPWRCRPLPSPLHADGTRAPYRRALSHPSLTPSYPTSITATHIFLGDTF